MSKTLLAASLACLVATATQASDLILTNGRIFTATENEWAQAIAVTDGKIERVGSNADVMKTKTAKTEIVDLKGRFVSPGFVDSHTHPWFGALALTNLNLSTEDYNITPEHDRAEFVARLKAYAAAHKAQPILFARAAFNHAPSKGPGLDILDDAVPDKPLIIHNTSEHALWVNSRALAMAGITDKPVDDPLFEKYIERDANGHPTGLMGEPAQELIERALPPMSMAERVRIMTAGFHYLNSMGVTSIAALTGGLDDLKLVDEIRKRGLLTLRYRQAFAAVSVKHKLTPEFLADLETARTTWHDDWISANLVKFFMDGAPTPPWYTQDEYNRIIIALDKAGFQTVSHALSTPATKMALDGYQAVQEANGPRDRRQRVEHGSVIAPEDVHRFAPLKVIVSTQPAFCCIKGRPSNPWQTLWKDGAVIDFSSDWPCSWAPSPVEGIEQAAMRYTRIPTVGPARGDGVPDTQPEERVTPEQALIAYTRNGAFANFWEGTRGTLEAGKYADLVVLDHNILDMPPQTIADTKVVATIVGGKIVYGALR